MPWLERWYGRHGEWYVRACGVIALLLLALALTPVATGVTARYMGLSFQEWAVSIAVAEPLIAVSVLIGVAAAWRDLQLVRRWAAGDRDGMAPADVAAAAHRLPVRLFTVTAAVAFVTALPAGCLATLVQLHRVHPDDFALLLIAGILFSLWGIVLLWTWGDLAMRPVLADVSHADPRNRTPGGTWWSVTVKLGFALGSAFLVGSCYGGALTAPAGTALGGLWRLVWVTLAVSAAFGLLLMPLFSALLLDPIRSLERATRALGSGNLDVLVPVGSNDELGRLAASFNEMVDGLRERSALRAHNAALVAQLRASQQRIVSSGNAARRRMERDLHDGVQQLLVTARLKARMLEQDPGDRQLLAEVEEDLADALRELRELGQGVYPAQLDAEGLLGALRTVADRAPMPCSVIAVGLERYDADVEAAVYFACSEALQNAVKHSAASAVRIELCGDRDGVAFSVADDGIGFEPSTAPGASGLQNIEDRVGALGGTAVVESAPGRGTTVSGSIPCRSALRR